MEHAASCIKLLNPSLHTHSFISKNRLMTSKTFFNRLIILGFMGLVGFCLAKAIYYGSVMGIILALTSLGAGIYFLYLLAKVSERTENEEAA